VATERPQDEYFITPDIPGLQDAISPGISRNAVAPTQSAALQTNPVPVTPRPSAPNPNWTDNFARRPSWQRAGCYRSRRHAWNCYMGWYPHSKQQKVFPFKGGFGLDHSCMCFGLGVACYLAYVEKLLRSPAVCVPHGGLQYCTTQRICAPVWTTFRRAYWAWLDGMILIAWMITLAKGLHFHLHGYPCSP